MPRAARDRTDFLTLAAVAALAVSLAVLAAGRPGTDGGAIPQPVAAAPGADQETTALEKYLGHYPPLPADGEKLSSFVREHPDNSRGHFFLGTLHFEEGLLGPAAEDYRRALELNRAYGDAKSGLYEGEKLGRLAEEGLKVFLREKELRPEDENVRRAIEDLYFIRRSLAGGCD